MTRAQRSDVAMKGRFNLLLHYKSIFFVKFGIYQPLSSCHKEFEVKCTLLAETVEDGSLLPVLNIDPIDAASFESFQELTLRRFKGEERDCDPPNAKYGHTLLNRNLFIIKSSLANIIETTPETEPCPIIRRPVRFFQNVKPPLTHMPDIIIPEVEDGMILPIPEGHPRNGDGNPIFLRRLNISDAPKKVQIKVEDLPVVKVEDGGNPQIKIEVQIKTEYRSNDASSNVVRQLSFK